MTYSIINGMSANLPAVISPVRPTPHPPSPSSPLMRPPFAAQTGPENGGDGRQSRRDGENAAAGQGETAGKARAGAAGRARAGTGGGRYGTYTLLPPTRPSSARHLIGHSWFTPPTDLFPHPPTPLPGNCVSRWRPVAPTPTSCQWPATWPPRRPPPAPPPRTPTPAPLPPTPSPPTPHQPPGGSGSGSGWVVCRPRRAPRHPWCCPRRRPSKAVLLSTPSWPGARPG